MHAAHSTEFRTLDKRNFARIPCFTIPMEKLGKRLKDVREELKLSYRALEAKSGVPVSTIRSIEAGSDPQISNVAKLAKGLGVPFEWLATGGGQKKRTAGGQQGPSVDDLLLIGIDAALDELKIISPSERHKHRNAAINRAHAILGDAPITIIEEVGDGGALRLASGHS